MEDFTIAWCQENEVEPGPDAARQALDKYLGEWTSWDDFTDDLYAYDGWIDDYYSIDAPNGGVFVFTY